MSRINDELLNKILLTIIAFILFIILVGTIYALAARKKNTPQNLIAQGVRKSSAPPYLSL